jgi:hypothetical protein
LTTTGGPGAGRASHDDDRAVTAVGDGGAAEGDADLAAGAAGAADSGVRIDHAIAAAAIAQLATGADCAVAIAFALAGFAVRARGASLGFAPGIDAQVLVADFSGVALRASAALTNSEHAGGARVALQAFAEVDAAAVATR